MYFSEIFVYYPIIYNDSSNEMQVPRGSLWPSQNWAWSKWTDFSRLPHWEDVQWCCTANAMVLHKWRLRKRPCHQGTCKILLCHPITLKDNPAKGSQTPLQLIPIMQKGCSFQNIPIQNTVVRKVTNNTANIWEYFLYSRHFARDLTSIRSWRHPEEGTLLKSPFYR